MGRLAWLTVVTVVVVGVVVVGCVAFVPAWIVRHDLGAAALSAGDRLKAVNDVRATLPQASP